MGKTLPGRRLSGLLLESESFCLALYGARGYLDGVPGAGALLLYSFRLGGDDRTDGLVALPELSGEPDASVA
jgi:hypothetical protein